MLDLTRLNSIVLNELVAKGEVVCPPPITVNEFNREQLARPRGKSFV